MRQPPAQQKLVCSMVLIRPSPQHVDICWELYRRTGGPAASIDAACRNLCGVFAINERMGGPVAGAAVPRAYVEAMCEEATSDLLCWAIENGLDQDGAQVGLFRMHCRSSVLPAAAVRAHGG